MSESTKSRSATRKNSRARSCRPRVAINTAWLTKSGRASISSWAMYEPIEVATIRTGATSSFSINRAVSATIIAVVNLSALAVAPTPLLSKVMTR